MTQHPAGIQLEAQHSGNEIRRPDLPARSVGHSTESPTGSGPAVARQLLYPYHNLVDPVERKIYNLVDWEKAALSLRGSSYTGGTETNHAGRRCIQWALVGYAARMGSMAPGDLRWLAEEFIEPMLRINKIPNVWSRTYGADAGFILASVHSPIRMGNKQWEDFSGITWHQTVPGQDHWDAGKLDWENLKRLVDNERPIGERPMQIPGRHNVISLGDRGEEVKQLEQLLVDFFPDLAKDVKVDGVFGKVTLNVVKAVQRRLKVKPDGFWGPKSALMFESYASDIAEAVVNGIKNDNLTLEERINRAVDNQNLTAEQLLDLIQTIEARYTKLYSTIDGKHNQASEGLLNLIQEARDSARKIIRIGDRVSELVS